MNNLRVGDSYVDWASRNTIAEAVHLRKGLLVKYNDYKDIIQ